MSDAPRVGIVVVSHSTRIADGVVELAGQMAPDAPLVAAGGADDGSLGTSFGKVSEALSAADAGAGVVVLTDLGSAGMTAESALEFLAADARARVRIADAPLVEGAVAAAVASQVGDGLDAVAASATAAGVTAPNADTASVPTEPGERHTGAPQESARHVRTVTLTNKDGLHARPAAEFVRLASTFDARVTVNGTDAKSLLGIMALGLLPGHAVEIAGGADAAAAVDALANLVESGFGDSSGG